MCIYYPDIFCVECRTYSNINIKFQTLIVFSSETGKNIQIILKSKKNYKSRNKNVIITKYFIFDDRAKQ